MLYSMLQAKLHRVRVTHAHLNYEGSCGIDQALLELAGIRKNQQIEIYNVTTGARFCTYVIVEPRDCGAISLNGAAARLVAVGDLLIICAYVLCTRAEMAEHQPTVIHVDDANRACPRPD